MTDIEIRGLSKEYKGVKAVDGLELSIRQGEIYCLLGINGAGKTTVLRLLSGMSEPTDGDALILGHSLRRERQQVKALIGISPQETAVAPFLTGKENLELMCGVHGFSREKTHQRVRALSGQFGLSQVLDRRAGTLSGGWQRRLSLAMAMIPEPRILLLDEPTLGLDVIVRSELWDVIRSLRGKTTVILTTHYLEEAEMLSDRIGIMRSGRLIVQGTVQELIGKAGEKRFEDAFIALMKGEVAV